MSIAQPPGVHLIEWDSGLDVFKSLWAAEADGSDFPLSTTDEEAKFQFIAGLWLDDNPVSEAPEIVRDSFSAEISWIYVDRQVRITGSETLGPASVTVDAQFEEG